ncbi:potassium channel subfamily U member 1 [Crotalus tigris]|uniref:potassium channel subfamily U member 1 n=1 Tax=Crotalus tigris TaxID=88082 RepID=UPI00192F5ECC|nr:potassium channel subfamily U member 1 [Crotalus tigris]
MIRIIRYVLRRCFFRYPIQFQLFTDKMLRISFWKGKFQDRVVMMISAQTSIGRILVILVFLFSIGSLIIYFINCYSVKEFCLTFQDQTIAIDLFFNLFFLLYFGLRFLAASDKLAFWLELNSIVDFFTITPVCIAFYLGRNWLGLRFLKALRLMELPKILQFLQITTSGTAIKLSKLLAVFVSTWLTAAGFLHWMENSGDPWVYHSNHQTLTYFECLYLIMVTMSTVGYGDVVVKTTIGRVFILFFIVGGLILFANLVPEIADIVGSRRVYMGSYISVKGRKFIVVCGNITLSSVTAFLIDFITQDRGDIASEIVFLGEHPPSLELETVFRCYTAYTTFFQGSVMNSKDLLRVNMGNAEACLILADICSTDPYTEDISNIMRVLSIKNHFPNTRVIIQIIQSSNKVYLPKLPGWDWRKGDSIICFAELKLGLIAQSCVVPGLSILLTSLFIRENIQQKDVWIKHQHEIEGQDYKVMTQLLSNDFVGMSFKDVCQLCFLKMDLILLAIDFRTGKQGNSILINPPSAIKLHYNTMGFFIASSVQDLKRAYYYCTQCHSGITNSQLIVKCHCKRKSVKKPILDSENTSSRHSNLRPSDEIVVHSRSLGILSFLDFFPRRSEEEEGEGEEIASICSLDNTGMFHWCEAVPFEMALLKPKKRFISDLRDHIVVCVFGDATSPLIGLRNFVMPLRASNFALSELKDIIFVGCIEYLEQEWEFIHNFPKLHILKGSGLSCADLKAAGIQYCSMCAILSANATDASNQTLVDTKSILATLNIRSLQFKQTASTVNPQGSSEDSIGVQSRIFSKRISVITELKVAANAQFFQQGGIENSDMLDYNLSKGALFSDSFLDSLLCTTYHNYHVLALLQTLVTGGTSPDLEEYLAEGNTLIGSNSNVMSWGVRNRCKLALLTLVDDPQLMEGLLLFFGDVFTKALDMYGILCFGIYRLKANPNPYEIRFVIARPPTNFEILASDQLFCLVPYNILSKDLTNVVQSIPPKPPRTVPQKKENDSRFEVIFGANNKDHS